MLFRSGIVGLLAGSGLPVAAFINELWLLVIVLLLLTIFNRVRAAAACKSEAR